MGLSPWEIHGLCKSFVRRTLKIIGIDVSLNRVDVVILDGLPKIALRDFYKSDDFKAVHSVWKSNEVDKLINLLASDESTNNCVVVLEGTGTYSYFWKEQFEKHNIPVLTADQGMVKSTKNLGLEPPPFRGT